jgi:hypothetical protein
MTEHAEMQTLLQILLHFLTQHQMECNTSYVIPLSAEVGA